MSDYQVMPDLAADEYAALTADIAEHGVRVPVDVDEHGVLLDGHHRRRIAAELGIDCPSRIVAGLDDDGKREHAFTVNMLRRQLGPVSWAGAFRRLAEARGVELGKRGRHNEKTAEVGASARTARRRLGLADELADYPDLAAKVDTGELAEHRARSDIHRRRRAARPVPEPLPPNDPRIDVRHGDMRDVLADLEAESVDLVFTDPPYATVEQSASYGALGAFAGKVLKPSRPCLAYSGQFWLPEAMAQLAEHLDYWWVYAVVHTGAFHQLHARHVNEGWKPVLVYRRPGPDRPAWVIDTFGGGKREKSGHEWQQALGEAVYWIGELTQPGDLVVDPFVGSGTTAVACQQLGRRFVGCDVDAAAVATARRRIAGEVVA